MDLVILFASGVLFLFFLGYAASFFIKLSSRSKYIEEARLKFSLDAISKLSLVYASKVSEGTLGEQKVHEALREYNAAIATLSIFFSLEKTLRSRALSARVISCDIGELTPEIEVALLEIRTIGFSLKDEGLPRLEGKNFLAFTEYTDIGNSSKEAEQRK